MSNKVYPYEFSQNLQQLIALAVFSMNAEGHSVFNENDFYTIFNKKQKELDWKKEIDFLIDLIYSNINPDQDLFSRYKIISTSTINYDENRILFISLEFSYAATKEIRAIQKELNLTPNDFATPNLKQKLYKLYEYLYEKYSAYITSNASRFTKKIYY